MRDHGLFQAICRVNRLDGDDKEYGYVIDYKDLFQSLEGAVTDYTSGAFDAYDKEDVVGLLTNRLDKAVERLEGAREAIKALCEPVDPPKNTEDYIRYFCGKDTFDPDQLKENESKRITLYKLVVSLIRAYANLANEMDKAGYSPEQTEQIKHEVDYYEKVRTEVKLASGDYIDLKMYEPAMRHLIDNYISAEESRKISAFDDLTLIQLIVERGQDAFKQLPEGIGNNRTAMAETIENNLRRVIIEEQAINPIYYQRMSELLGVLIQQRKSEALQYEVYLRQIVELTRQISNPARSGTAYPSTLTRAAQRALYDNLGRDEALSLALDHAIQHVRQDNWRGNLFKERAVRYAIKDYVQGDAEVERIFELVKNQRDY
jgi:type I restriction enzyme R subunit